MSVWRMTAVALVLLLFAYPAQAALIDQVNRAYRAVHGSTPTSSQWAYWAGRVQRGEKKTYNELLGAMSYQKVNGSSVASSTGSASTVAAVSGFKTEKKFYPSAHNPNFLPEGTLVRGVSSPEVYYLRNGKKSWVMSGILNRWFGDNHFFKSSIVLTISDSDLARYPQTSSVNKLYIGKVLQHPNGVQYYIDDKLRKRKIPSPAVRSALKFPAGNLYPTSAAHLREFQTGPAISKTNMQPGGMAIYDGSFHGGRIWQVREGVGGRIMKHLYLKDRFYEADGYPDENQRAPVDAAMLARHPRGSNIDRYPDGWVIGIGSNIYVMEGGARRLIASPEIFNAMGYKPHHIRKEYPELYKKYAQGQPIRAFKGVVAGAPISKGAPAAAPSSASNLTKVRPNVRSMIANMNSLYISMFDKDPTLSENKFWVDYVYNGEVSNKADLLSSMSRTANTGNKPARTSRTATLDSGTLKNKWFSYLFYFVHQQEPSEDDRNYWYSRIAPGDRDSIEKLGGTIQWLKGTSGATRR